MITCFMCNLYFYMYYPFNIHPTHPFLAKLVNPPRNNYGCGQLYNFQSPYIDSPDVAAMGVWVTTTWCHRGP